MPSDLFLKSMNAVHRGLLRVTGGRVGGRAMGMPVLELITTGRKTRQRRACMLTSPVQDGDSYIVVASRGGDDHHPGWYHNLTADPEVEVVVDGRTRPMRARTATPDERAAYWPKVTAAYKGYGNYQKRTTREIPLVVLEPR